MVSCTRLADLVNTMDPALVAAAFGMNPQGVMALPDRPRRGPPASAAHLEPVNFRRHLAHVHANMCALVIGWFVVMIVLVLP